MLRIEDMKRVLILGVDTHLKKVITELYKQGILHITEHKSTAEIDIGTPLEESHRLAEIIVSIRAMIDYLKIDISKAERLIELPSLKDIEEDIKSLNKTICKIQDRINVIDNTIKEKQQILDEIWAFKKLNLPIEVFSGYKSIVIFVGHITKLSNFILELNGITKEYELISLEEENKLYFAVFLEHKNQNAVLNLLQRHGFVSANVEKYKNSGKEPREIFNNTAMELDILRDERINISEEINKIKVKWEGYLISAERYINEEIKRAQIPLMFAKTKDTFLVSGWVPDKKLNKLTQRLNKITNESVYIVSKKPDAHDTVPVKFNNTKLVEPFEFFMNLYSLPSHAELDPTFFVFLSFPIFFGFMLGDIGYGIVSLFAFLLLKKKLPKIAGFFNILILASISTILFGIIFGEFFGAEELFGYHIPRLISRNPEHHLEPLMISAIFFGIVHVNAGLIIGFFNELHGHGIKKAILSKGSWILIELAVILLILAYMKILNINPIFGYIALGSALIMLLKGEGARGIVEIPGLFGNILSYLRLMAIGLSSVGLAIVINELAGKFFEHISIVSIFGIIILIVGHILNIGIGILGSFLHSLRLHYVEFFTKFYKGGGTHYEPFGRKSY